MGHPISGIEYLLKEWHWLKENRPHAFYLFLMFTQRHREFARFFENNFEQLDQESGHEVMFFAIAPPPPRWLHQAERRDYWKHYLANSMRGVGYTDKAVEHAARYFGVPAINLPAVVLFRDLDDSDVITIGLKQNSESSLSHFFQQLFVLLKSPDSRGLPLEVLRDRIDTNQPLSSVMPQDHSPPTIPETEEILPELFLDLGERGNPYGRLKQAEVVYTEFSLRLSQMLERMQHDMVQLTEEVRRLRSEQRAAFEGVNNRLGEVQITIAHTAERIVEFRTQFVAQHALLESQATSLQEMQRAQARLHREFDRFLEQQSQKLVEQLQGMFPPRLPLSIAPFEKLLEDQSRIALVTSETLWRYLESDKSPDATDYAVCGIGLWKALEIEVNRTFVDALRVYRQLARPGRPSILQPVLAGTDKVIEKGRFAAKTDDVVISSKRQGTLAGLELGKVAGLLANAPNNSFATLVQGSSWPLVSTYASPPEFLQGLGDQVDEVAQKYRNGYAHMQAMRRSACQEFREFVLEDRPPHTPLLATLRWKKDLQIKGLI